MGECGSSSQALVIRWWHVAVAVLSAALTMGVIYGNISSRMSSHEEHLKVLDEQTVKKPEFDEMRQDIKERLQRIENKLDNAEIRPKK